MYGKLINGEIQYAPKDYILGNGKILFNFDSDVALLKKYKYKLIEDEKPDYNKNTQFLVIDSCVENDNTIIINYAIKDNDIPKTSEELLQLKIDDLQNEQIIMAQALQELILSTMNLGE